MLVQIYEISSPEEAIALGGLGVDHIGVLVGEGEFPRERTIDQARLIFSAIPASSKGVALLLSADVRFIEHVISELKPTILHLGASTDLLTPSTVRELKKQCRSLTVMRSIPVVGEESIAIAKSYDGVADMLLLDSLIRPGIVLTFKCGKEESGASGLLRRWRVLKLAKRANRKGIWVSFFGSVANSSTNLLCQRRAKGGTSVLQRNPAQV
jgi:phosphoribosylanthranilate isomerase